MKKQLMLLSMGLLGVVATSAFANSAPQTITAKIVGNVPQADDDAQIWVNEKQVIPIYYSGSSIVYASGDNVRVLYGFNNESYVDCPVVTFTLPPAALQFQLTTNSNGFVTCAAYSVLV